MAPTFPLQPNRVDALVVMLQDSEFSPEAFLSGIHVLTGIQQVSIRIQSLSEAMALLDSLRCCATRAQAMALLDPKCVVEYQRLSAGKDIVAAEIAWKIGYTGYDIVLDMAAQQLRGYSKEWDPEKRYVPLTSIVQSSGWGKSRLLHELWSKGIYVFYISCLDKRKTGYPGRTQGLADVLKEGLESELIALLSSIMSVLEQNPGKSCREWMEWQEKGECYKQVLATYELTRGKVATPPMSGGGSLTDAVQQYGRCFNAYKPFLAPSLEELAKQGKFLLLCVDEAMDLGDAYVRFRQALKYIPKKGAGVFFVVAVGTDTTVSSLAAAYYDDPSARVRLQSDSNQIYDPIWLVGSSDVLAAATSGIVDASTSFATSSSDFVDESAEMVLQYGRPLWAAYLRSLRSDSKVTAAIQLAKKKLLGGDVDLRDSSRWLTRDMAVAVLGTLIGLDVVAWGTLPQQAAARHMRTIVKISKDRNRVYTASAAEPALAAAAAELLHLDVCGFIDKLVEVCVDGLVLEGVRGEMVARLVMLLGMHECTKGDNYIKPVPVREYLTQMYGERTAEKLEECGVPMNHTLFFNYFVPTTSRPSGEFFRECYRRNAASISKRNEAVVDLVLPTRSNKGVVDGCLPAQVKNLKNITSQNLKKRKAGESIDADEQVDEQVLSIVHRVGWDEESVRVENGVLYVDGLGGRFLSQERNLRLKDSLKRLAKTCEDALRDMSNEERVVLEDLIPLSYKTYVANEDGDDMEE